MLNLQRSFKGAALLQKKNHSSGKKINMSSTDYASQGRRFQKWKHQLQLKRNKVMEVMEAPSLQLKWSSVTSPEFPALFFSSSTYTSLSDMIPALSLLGQRDVWTPGWDPGLLTQLDWNAWLIWRFMSHTFSTSSERSTQAVLVFTYRQSNQIWLHKAFLPLRANVLHAGKQMHERGPLHSSTTAPCSCSAGEY